MTQSFGLFLRGHLAFIACLTLITDIFYLLFSIFSQQDFAFTWRGNITAWPIEQIMSKQSLTEAAKTHEAKMLDALRKLASHEVKLELSNLRNKVRVLTEQRGTYREAASRYQKQIIELRNKLNEKQVTND